MGRDVSNMGRRSCYYTSTYLNYGDLSCVDKVTGLCAIVSRVTTL
jgi:hypothetical protein